MIPRTRFIQALRSVAGRPYIWGGQDPDGGFDCSGLILWALAQAGIELPDMTASGLYSVTASNERAHPGEYIPGDLVFYVRRGTKRINHVMALLDIWEADPFMGAVYGARGGGSKTTDTLSAHTAGAMVCAKPWSYRSADILAVTSPFEDNTVED